MSKAMVALSGGQDSATCLAWALANYDRAEAISIDYGQRHRVELDCAARIADTMGVRRSVFSVPAFREMGAASLTNEAISSQSDASGTGNEFAAARGLPSSFVPGRNVVLLGLAGAWGLLRGAQTLVSGICQEDEAGYPDCRQDFAEALRCALRLGTATPDFDLVTPLMHRSKAETFALAHELGVLNLIVTETHTCYNGDHEHLHAWGYGCGQCPACQTRAAGWQQFTSVVSV